MFCPKCKAQLPPNAVACPKCGTRFKTKICPYCNSAIMASATTCPRCGKKFAQSAQPQASQAAASGRKKTGFRWWYILVGLGIFILGAIAGAFGMRQYIITNVKSAFNQAADSFKDFTSSSAANDKDAAQKSSEKGPDETAASTDYYFANNVLVTEDVKI